MSLYLCQQNWAKRSSSETLLVGYKAMEKMEQTIIELRLVEKKGLNSLLIMLNVIIHHVPLSVFADMLKGL